MFRAIVTTISDRCTAFRNFFCSYPVIADRDALCAFYRKQNNYIPCVFLLFVLGGIGSQLMRIVSAVMFEQEAAKTILSLIPGFLISDSLQILAAIYAFSLRRLALLPEHKDFLLLQQSVRRRQQICRFSLFIGLLSGCVLFLASRDESEPASLMWVIAFVVQLFSCIWSAGDTKISGSPSPAASSAPSSSPPPPSSFTTGTAYRTLY